MVDLFIKICGNIVIDLFFIWSVCAILIRQLAFAIICLLIHILVEAFACDRCNTVEESAFVSEITAPEATMPPVLRPGFA